MDIRERVAGSVTVLDLVGRLVLSEGFRDTLLKDLICERMVQGRRHFVLELAQVSQIDTSGLTMLVGAHVTVVRRGGQIRLMKPTKRIHELLRITKLNTFFEVFDNEETAFRSFPPEIPHG
jgi:anti-sigma B factor antagonist